MYSRFKKRPKGENEMKTIKEISTYSFAIIGFVSVMVLILAAIFSKYPLFTDDYIRNTKDQLYIKIRSFKDSSMNHVNQPKEYNRYVDSSSKYIDIYNYLK